MEKKSIKIFAKALKAPLVILVIICFLASIYLAIYHLSGISYPVPIIFGIIVLLYFIGIMLEIKTKDRSF